MPIVINGTTGISGVDGSAGTPAVQGTDTNTGVFYPAADTVGVSTGGSERVRVDSSGNVGIGTSSPESIANFTFLSVGGSTSTKGVVQTYDGTVKTALYSNGTSVGTVGTRTAHPLTFIINGAETARIDTSGNLLFNSGYGSAATAYGCRAWVNFNGTVATPSTIRGSGNVTSITKNSTGNYTMNLTTALPDTNYAPVCSGSRSSVYLGYGVLKGRPSSTSACNIYFYIEDVYGGESALDGDILCVSIFR